MNSVTTAPRSGPARRDARRGPGASRLAEPGSRPSVSPLVRFLRGREPEPRWARPALLMLLVATAVLYFWNLTASGWANAFYSAAVQAGSTNWEAFFFGSSDAANAITVDKPPASLWVMDLSVRAFGLNSFAILMPQVLMGVGTVALVHATVKRYFGVGGGLLAGGVMALTPVAVLMFRFNNPDALLVLLMTAAAWATMHAVERGSVRWMTLVGVLVGLGFLTKTLQAFLVVPFFGLAFLTMAAAPLRRRIIGALAALLAVVVSGGWWVLVTELTPSSMRPYIGGSQNNSFLDLTFGYNGFGRLSGQETGSVGGGGGAAGSGMWGQTGLTRLFGSEIGGQISWLLPSALVLLLMGLVFRGRAPRTDLRRAAYAVWGGWLLVTMLTFSYMAGIFHAYYTVALAPAIAVVVGMGGAEAWERRNATAGPVTLAVATAAASTWGFILLSRTTAYSDVLRVAVLAIGMAAAFLLLAIRWLDRRFVPVVVVGALLAGLAGPTAYSLSTVASGHAGSIVTAGPAVAGGGPGGGGRAGAGAQAPGAAKAPTSTQGSRAGGTGPGREGSMGAGAGGGMGGLLNATTPSTQVVTALSADATRYTWVAAAVGSQNAAGLQLGTQLPVMALGGFNGSDPSPTLAQFQAYARAGKIHYVLAGSTTTSNSDRGTAAQILSWVAGHYRLVTLGGETFYDLTQSKA